VKVSELAELDLWRFVVFAPHRLGQALARLRDDGATEPELRALTTAIRDSGGLDQSCCLCGERCRAAAISVLSCARPGDRRVAGYCVRCQERYGGCYGLAAETVARLRGVDPGVRVLPPFMAAFGAALSTQTAL
jgi:hypothetical protein